MALKEKLVRLLPQRHLDIGKDFPLEYFLPVYHTVSDRNLPHLKHIISYKNQKEFVKDLEVMLRHFQFVNWEEFKASQKGEFKAKKKIALLTFDDGLRDFKETIVPILLEKGIFALNFINPKFIDNQDLSFRCKASLIKDFLMNENKIPPSISDILSVPNHQNSDIIQKIMSIPYAQQDLLDKMALELGIHFNDFLKKEQPYLQLEDLHKLEQQGFLTGAHSWDHPLYSELSVEDQLDQSQRPLDYLRKNRLSAETFAFPFTDDGVSKKFFQMLSQKEKNLFCTFGSAGIKRDSIVNNFQRVPMENQLSAEETLKQEIAYFNLKKYLGKNKINRG